MRIAIVLMALLAAGCGHGEIGDEAVGFYEGKSCVVNGGSGSECKKHCEEWATSGGAITFISSAYHYCHEAVDHTILEINQ